MCLPYHGLPVPNTFPSTQWILLDDCSQGFTDLWYLPESRGWVRSPLGTLGLNHTRKYTVMKCMCLRVSVGLTTNHYSVKNLQLLSNEFPSTETQSPLSYTTFALWSSNNRKSKLLPITVLQIFNNMLFFLKHTSLVSHQYPRIKRSIQIFLTIQN